MRYERSDTPEEIQGCLNCRRKTCTNCLYPQQRENKRERLAVIAYQDDEEDMLFDDVADAADFFDVKGQLIGVAIKRRTECCGYYWKYVGDKKKHSGKTRKLTKGDVVKIKALISEGARTINIARQFGVTESTICDIKYGRSHKNVGGA